MKRLLTLLILALSVTLSSCGGSEKKEAYQLDLSKVTQGEIDTAGLELFGGDLISVIKGPSGVVVKAKIKPSYNKDMTVRQNYHNVCRLITDNGFDVCDEIQYWAVADMTTGEESKVVAFTVSKDVIKLIKDEKIFPTNLEDYLDDLFILPSLRE